MEYAIIIEYKLIIKLEGVTNMVYGYFFKYITTSRQEKQKMIEAETIPEAWKKFTEDLSENIRLVWLQSIHGGNDEIEDTI